MKKSTRKKLYRLFDFIDFRKIKSSNQEIDVTIPVIKKDLNILPLCIEGIRNCVAHPIKNIYIVAPPLEEIISFCESHHLIFVDENTVLGFSPKDIDLKIMTDDGTFSDRSGWLFQQLIKLSGNKFGTCENYLCIDSDHILLQSHAFLSKKNKAVFYMSSECHQPYYRNLEKLMGSIKLSKLSYVSHKMIFNKKKIEYLQNYISKRHNTGWIQAIIHNYDRQQSSGFSEFELYGNFVKNKITTTWRELALNYDKISDYKTLFKQYGKNYKCITFPEYLN
ncbi:MAG: DUF6492 family protein [Bacteroidales bacterium]|nr:DUF6492 family protein [Bacteroidales bacterium]